jgi:hypothetical protein
VGRLLLRAVPATVVAVAVATVAVVAMRTLLRRRAERDWNVAWDAYQRAGG